MTRALFIGHTYIDINFLTQRLPVGDEKLIADDYTVSFGGNAVSAAFAAVKLGLKADLLCNIADDPLSGMFIDMAKDYNITIHPRSVSKSSATLIFPKDGKRALVRCRTNDYGPPPPEIDLKSIKAVHVDGHQPDLALHYAKKARAAGVLTSLDGGNIRENTEELLPYIDVAVVSELFSDNLGSASPEHTLDYLKSFGVKIAAVTLGKHGIVFTDEAGGPYRLAALPLAPEKVVDTSGAGDIFHGAYLYSALTNPTASWREHFAFARAASAHSVQYLGNINSCPTLNDVQALLATEQNGQ